MALTDGLVAYYSLEGDATDETSTNDGSIIGSPSTVSGIQNNCLSLNGTSEYIATFEEGDLTTSRSWNVWFKYSEATSGGENIIGARGGTNATQVRIRVDYSIGDGQLYFYLRDTNGYYDTYNSGETTYRDGAWHMATITWTSGTTKFYVDGNQVGSTGENVVGTIGLNTTTVIGAYNQTGSISGYFQGLIDEVGIWSKELSSSEVSELWNGGSGLAYPFSGGAPPVGDTNFFGCNF